MPNDLTEPGIEFLESCLGYGIHNLWATLQNQNKAGNASRLARIPANARV